MNTEKRMIHSFEVTQCIQIGSKEIVVAIDENAADGMKYMCCFVERNDLLEFYKEAFVSDRYAEIIEIFGERVNSAAIDFINESKGMSHQALTDKDCIPDNYKDNIQGKIVVRNAKDLRPEYQRAESQLYFITGGNGSHSNARGSAVFCTNLHSGKNVRIERMEVIGEIKPECMPEWAKEKAEALKRAEKRKNKEAER